MQAAPTVTGISKKVSRRSLLGVPTPGGGGLGSAIGRHSVTVELLGSWRVSVVAKQRSTLSRQDPNYNYAHARPRNHAHGGHLRSRRGSQPRSCRGLARTGSVRDVVGEGQETSGGRPYRVSMRGRRGHGRSCIVNQMRTALGAGNPAGSPAGNPAVL